MNTYSADTPDWYAILGVDSSASDADLRSAYRRAALRWHPDKQRPSERPYAEEQFKLVAEAYSTLSDPDKRAAYDHGGESWCDTDDAFRRAHELFAAFFGTVGTDRIRHTQPPTPFSMRRETSTTIVNGRRRTVTTTWHPDGRIETDEHVDDVPLWGRSHPLPGPSIWDQSPSQPFFNARGLRLLGHLDDERLW